MQPEKELQKSAVEYTVVPFKEDFSLVVCIVMFASSVQYSTYSQSTIIQHRLAARPHIYMPLRLTMRDIVMRGLGRLCLQQ
jgi:hypothetical protein